MSSVREWDAASYDALPLPHVAWGQRVLDRMELAGLGGDELVLDAGCGTGRDAAALLERWPGVRVVGIDGSQQMLDQARERLGDRATLVRADLTRPPLPVPEPVDAVMSVAAFHWIQDHAGLFANLRAAMRPGAALTTDCGGRGNVAGVNRALARVTGEEHDGWEFAGEDDTRARLLDAGFEVRSVVLRADPFRCEDADVLERYLATVVLGSKLDALPEADRAGFVRDVRLALDEPVVDYVRLEIDAVAR
ncbi:class I SAM-dependent methyltransferase [Nocardioides mangrovi]|uniref:Methyltransferase domain-containing protein n=1 Tax=Nocardioides mangrovi TaxID=2874580 RepID=A0ABS7UKI1_9ACTN|nr:class I SAM-dependent methyltransferase [Nocardioides mangrovi]MBZ5741148.1 methyltransferase domain-containing protein [Nocardioides mangrovi]